jgi:hypothetical protein
VWQWNNHGDVFLESVNGRAEKEFKAVQPNGMDSGMDTDE